MAPFALPARSAETELLDAPCAIREDLPGNLADIRRLNRWFGGTRPALRAVRWLLGGMTSASLLDVATGSADVPAAVRAALQREVIHLDVTALDSSPEVLEVAAGLPRNAGMTFVRGDARDLPFADGEFDVVMCCLALHHFEPGAATAVLREMWRVARIGIAVTDLRRSRAGYLGAWVSTRTVARNRLTRNDGPLSVLRSYTPEELERLARGAGIGGADVGRTPFFRMLLTARKGIQSAR